VWWVSAQLAGLTELFYVRAKRSESSAIGFNAKSIHSLGE
jgi:hypothetical protein